MHISYEPHCGQVQHAPYIQAPTSPNKPEMIKELIKCSLV